MNYFSSKNSVCPYFGEEEMAENIKKGFKNPGKEFRGAPFWSWNDDLEDKELVRQIKEMDEKGWGGFFMHSRIGLITPYLSKEWMDRIKTCVREAKKRGMSAWLYDEDRWPSGFAGGIVPAKGQEYRIKGLECTIVQTDPPGKGEQVSAKMIYDRNSPWYNNYSYPDTMNPKAVNAFIESTYEAYYKEVGSEFGKSVPGIFTDEPNYFRFQPFRLLDEKKKVCIIPWTDDFPKYFHGKKGYEIMEKLPLLFIEKEGFEKVRYDYWETATDLFLEVYSKGLYGWCEEHNLRYTGHYLCEDTFNSQILCIGAAMPHYEYMHVPGIDHLCRNIGNIMTPKQCSSVAHQLGKERVLSETYGCSGQNFSFVGRKWIGDWEFVLGINFLNHHLSLYSMKGCRKRDYPPNIYYQQPWWKYNNVIEDYFTRLSYILTRGKHKCDILVIHTIGSAWAAYKSSDTKTCDDFSDAFDRLSLDLCAIQRDYDYGDEKLMEKYARLAWVEVQGEGTFKKRLPRIQVGESVYEVVIIPPALTLRKNTFRLLKNFVDAGGKVVAVEPIPTMVDCQDSSDLKEFISSIKVIPANRDSIKVVLDEILEPQVILTNRKKAGVSAIYYQYRVAGDRDIYFFCNTDQEKEYNTVVKLKSSGKVEEWDLFTGNIREIPFQKSSGPTACLQQADGGASKGKHIQIELNFPPAGSHLITIERGKTSLKQILEKIIPHLDRKIKETKIRFSDEWGYERKDVNALTLDYCRYRIGNETKWSGMTPIWKVQRMAEEKINQKECSTAIYRTNTQKVKVEMQLNFQIDYELQEKSRIFLVLENPTIYKIKINGKTVDYQDIGYWLDISFKKINILPFVKKGENIIELSCQFKSPMKPNTMIYVKDGVELESCYIVGDFGVEHRDRKEFKLIPEREKLLTGDLVDQGYPFFTGTIALSQTVNINKEKGRRYNFEFNRLNAIVTHVFINGKSAGLMIFPPFKLDVTNLLKNGENKITLELVHSLHNLLGPHHKQGELLSVGPGDFTDEGGWSGANWHNDYFFVKYGIE